MIDYIYDHRATHKEDGKGESDEKDFVIRQFNQRILYNLRTVVQLLFDHDAQVLEWQKRGREQKIEASNVQNGRGNKPNQSIMRARGIRQDL